MAYLSLTSAPGLTVLVGLQRRHSLPLDRTYRVGFPGLRCPYPELCIPRGGKNSGSRDVPIPSSAHAQSGCSSDTVQWDAVCVRYGRHTGTGMMRDSVQWFSHFFLPSVVLVKHMVGTGVCRIINSLGYGRCNPANPIKQ